MRHIILTISIAVATGSALSASQAESQSCPPPAPSALRPVPKHNDVYRRFHASSCWVETDYIGDYVVGPDGITNVSQERRRDVYCPITEDSILSQEPASRYEQVVVNGIDASETDLVLATVCTADPTSMMTTCGADVISARNNGWGTAAFTIDPCWLIDSYTFDLNLVIPTLQAGFYSFVAISLPAKSAGTVLGYEVSRCDNPEACMEDYCVGNCPPGEF